MARNKDDNFLKLIQRVQKDKGIHLYKTNVFNEIFKRDDFRCVWCDRSNKTHKIKLTVSHVYPISKGGTSDLFNLVTCCTECRYPTNNLLILSTWQRNFKLNRSIPIRFQYKLEKYFKQYFEDPINSDKNYVHAVASRL